MTERKLSGFDINGWRDFAAKNWRQAPGEEEEMVEVEIVQSGPLSSVVKVGTGYRTRWIGGSQADIAPHGLGDGWGEVGSNDRRASLRSLLEMRDQDINKLSASLKGLAYGGYYNILSIDEGEDGSEETQEHLLKALSEGKYRNSALVWRPVLATIYAIEQKLLSEGQLVGVICQNRQGFSVQKLLIRSARGVLAPERRASAKSVSCDAGYEHLVKQARYWALGDRGLSSSTSHRAAAQSVGKAALGLPLKPEILRAQNGDWEILDIRNHVATFDFQDVEHDLNLQDCSIVLFETLCEGKLKQNLEASIKRASNTSVRSLPADAVARGALIAARRASSGAPIFFDFLPRLSTIVFGEDGASNFDLVRSDEILEAGRVYRSPKPAQLAIPSGQQNISVYLRKEAEPHPRKATIEIGRPLGEAEEVSLWVEQKPASGRARIFLEAPGLGRNFSVDWDEAKQEELPWQEIIDSFEARSSIPRRLVLPCGMHPWNDSEHAEGLLSLLKREGNRSNHDWDTLAAKLSQRPFNQYCVSSDGALPDEVQREDVDKLDRLTDVALEINRMRLRGETAPGTEDNGALKFLTWQFRRCPQEVADWFLDCITDATQPHPFVRHQASWVLVYQGLGRIVRSEDTERRAITLLLSTKVENWVWNRQSAGMAFLLSRSDTAPLFLIRQDVERLAKRVIADFRLNIGQEYTRFHYAPFLLAGLLRWRLKEPTALLPEADPIADALLRVIDDAENDLSGRRRPSMNLERRKNKFIPILQDLRDELYGEGSNPDLLLDIYNSSGS